MEAFALNKPILVKLVITEDDLARLQNSARPLNTPEFRLAWANRYTEYLERKGLHERHA